MMESSPAEPPPVSTTGGSTLWLARPGDRLLLALVAVALAGIAAAFMAAAVGGVGDTAGEVALLLATAVATAVVGSLARRPEAWRATRWTALGLALSLAFQAVAWLDRSVTGTPQGGEIFAANMAILLATLLGALGMDFSTHIRGERLPLVLDVALVATVTGAAVYLLLRTGQVTAVSGPQLALTALLAGAAVLLVAGWGVLTLWCPTPVHLSLMVTATLAAAAAIGLAHARHFEWAPGALLAPEVAAAVAVLGTAAVLLVEPRLTGEGPREARGNPWVRPTLLALSLGGTFLIALVPMVSEQFRLGLLQAGMLVGVVYGVVAVRMVTNYLEVERAAAGTRRALAEREEALASLRSASEVLATSEASHRLLLQAAVDGIVELDHARRVVRANEAFCRMVGLLPQEVLDRTWEEVAERSGEGSPLAALAEGGHVELQRDGGVAHLEARTSALPTNPPGLLLLIRDVTASKATEQTIRSLFKFMQDRDEDRTRLLKRSNAAIEAERNRIARDLHDGPIQGVSATVLSIEAVRLMLLMGDTERAAEMLQQVGGELDQEAVNLRRIMSDLRPPVLEERGLIPAVRDLAARLQRELDIPVMVEASTTSDVPPDIETLAYRVVQESLSNVAKHAGASSVRIRIEVKAGTLEVAVRDDGRGFDPTAARQFLAGGKVGLASMRERAELAGGTFSVKSEPGAGTTVVAVVPFDVLGMPG